MKVVALIPAAGMGKRMGAGMNKQYLLLGGLPIVGRTISVFQKAPFIDDIYVISPEDEIPYCRENVVAAMGLTKVRAVVPGGAERQYSVHNGLKAIADIADDDIILIHDGVRPFIRPDILAAAVDTARTEDGALVAVPAKDTIKVVTGTTVTDTPPRETLWLAQTPQAFRFGIISRAHKAAADAGFLGTDDCSLVERRGGKITVVMGDYRNIKITTPEDMLLGETLLKEFPL